jgi:hypothetical protein
MRSNCSMDAVNATATYRKPFDHLRRSRFEKMVGPVGRFRTFYASRLADEAPLSAPQQSLVADRPKPDELPVGIEREDASEQPVAPERKSTNVHSGPFPSSLSPRRRRGKSIQTANCSRSQHSVGIDQSDSAAASFCNFSAAE